MPYVANEHREEVDKFIDSLVVAATTSPAIPQDKLAGLTNYIISRITTGILKPKNYSQMKDVVGTFEAAKLEFVRRIMNPYEDAAIEKNGDITEYEAFGFRKGA